MLTHLRCGSASFGGKRWRGRPTERLFGLANEIVNTGVGPGRRRYRKREIEMRAAVLAVRARNDAAMRIDDRLANGEADADSRILGAEEAFENVIDVRVGDARS